MIVGASEGKIGARCDAELRGPQRGARHALMLRALLLACGECRGRGRGRVVCVCGHTLVSHLGSIADPKPHRTFVKAVCSQVTSLELYCIVLGALALALASGAPPPSKQGVGRGRGGGRQRPRRSSFRGQPRGRNESRRGKELHSHRADRRPRRCPPARPFLAARWMLRPRAAPSGCPGLAAQRTDLGSSLPFFPGTPNACLLRRKARLGRVELGQRACESSLWLARKIALRRQLQ